MTNETILVMCVAFVIGLAIGCKITFDYIMFCIKQDSPESILHNIERHNIIIPKHQERLVGKDCIVNIDCN